MPEQEYGTVFGLFTLDGFDWGSLTDDEKHKVHKLFFSDSFYGFPREHFGFARVAREGEVYYGHFTQQYEEVMADYLDPSSWRTRVEYPYEDRFFLYLPSSNLFVLERRKFMRRQGLTAARTQARIENLFQNVLPRYKVRMEPFTHHLSREEMVRYFYSYQVFALRVEGLRGKHLPEDFIFFNPHYDKNAISRELFNSKIFPFMNSIDLAVDTADGGFNPLEPEDLRKNVLAKAAVEVGERLRELIINNPEIGTQRIKPDYDDSITLNVETNDPNTLCREILENIYRIPERRMNINIRLNSQPSLFGEDDIVG